MRHSRFSRPRYSTRIGDVTGKRSKSRHRTYAKYLRLDRPINASFFPNYFRRQSGDRKSGRKSSTLEKLQPRHRRITSGRRSGLSLAPSSDLRRENDRVSGQRRPGQRFSSDGSGPPDSCHTVRAFLRVSHTARCSMQRGKQPQSWPRVLAKPRPVKLLLKFLTIRSGRWAASRE